MTLRGESGTQSHTCQLYLVGKICVTAGEVKHYHGAEPPHFQILLTCRVCGVTH